MSLGAVLSCGLSWMLSFANGLAGLLFSWGANGLAQSMAWAPSSRVLSNWWSASHRGRVARVADHAELFSEAPSRVVVCVAADDLAPVERAAEAAGVTATRLGVATGDRLVVKDLLDVGLADATRAWRDRLPDALGAGTTQG